jgi:DNA-directed RNA polymerase beta subunit
VKDKDFNAINHAYNNFEQKLKVTKEQIEDLVYDRISIKDLIDAGCLEYIAADEVDEILCCEDPETFEKYRHDPFHTFTHVQLPASVYGISTLTQPGLNHNPSARIAYQAAHGNQAGGIQDYSNKFEKELFNQYMVTNPILRTISYNYTLPNGISTGVAIASCMFSNEEDSYEQSQTAVAIGLFYGVKSTVIDRLMIPTSESLRDPASVGCTPNKRANYTKIAGRQPPMVKVGDILNKGDVMMYIVKQGPDKKYTDTSLIYRGDETCIVDGIAKTQPAKGTVWRFKIRLFRPAIQQDKYSSRHGQKGIVGGLYTRADMICNKYGMAPVFVGNPHAFPTRMTVAQIIEQTISKAAAIKGINVDGTAYNKLDIDEARDYLSKKGFNPNVSEVFYNRYGGRINNPILYGPIFMQRIQKFAMDLRYNVVYPKLNVMTQQPTRGVSDDGGIKLGEMERDVLITHGAAAVIENTFINNSDPLELHVCIKCNYKMQIFASDRRNSKCANCGSMFIDQAVQTSYTTNLLLNEIQFMGVNTQIYTEPYLKVND